MQSLRFTSNFFGKRLRRKSLLFYSSKTKSLQHSAPAFDDILNTDFKHQLSTANLRSTTTSLIAPFSRRGSH